MGVAPGLKAFIAAVLGGIGIIPGALIGGFAIGIIETMISGYGSSLIKDAVVYYSILKHVLGDEWCNNKLFRIGTSRLSSTLLDEIRKI